MPEHTAHKTRRDYSLTGPEAARAFIDTQIDTWAKVVKDNDIKAD